MASWDEAHLHEPKQKSAKCIWEENKMQMAEKDIEQQTEPLGRRDFAFSVCWEGIKM